ncbi:MAG: alpha/beta hydrolase [Clostridium sp.]|jgi:non-heme chloroperoxidase|uniref:alpha/beta fold hydrolase n=1 Tax=Clostridium sp. TaxID=1506 RepID=UPI0025C6A8C5|nr:alpha/beta hydrolase [Clostridium sp.]MCH3965910.1 alpha/beta hydrolase [Clostridium sp.]MCI1716001.1 alpha/beta hydrolase [Clostridium sp.]MCI1800327.1 alpha/beta hydrolase [Clostridium sp.]MCI1814178.1 alpha/beta hydrolase [Clostridium sp.]MCI1871077.1 alpha/beta hydrolase [Clostridium sp.]
MYYIEVEEGIKILVDDLNPRGKDVIFLIHGWPLNHKMFEYQLDLLPEYGYRCISIDLRGFGSSDKPWKGYSYDRLSDDVRVIIETLELKNITLVGFSMGAAVAIRYMSRYYSYNVSKLVLMSPAAPSFTRRKGYPYGMDVNGVEDLIRQARENRPEMMAGIGKIFFAGNTTDNFMNWFQNLGLEASGHSTIETARSLKDEDLRSEINKINVTTGIFHGKMDKICPFEFAEELNRGIKNSQLYPFEFSGHGIFHDELGKFNSELLKFIKG